MLLCRSNKPQQHCVQSYSSEHVQSRFSQPTLWAARCKHTGAPVSLSPLLLPRFIDDGGHPDDFVRGTFRAAIGDNQVSCGVLPAEARATTFICFHKAALAAGTTSQQLKSAVHLCLPPLLHALDEACTLWVDVSTTPSVHVHTPRCSKPAHLSL